MIYVVIAVVSFIVGAVVGCALFFDFLFLDLSTWRTRICPCCNLPGEQCPDFWRP